jgi:hypothetical protein
MTSGWVIGCGVGPGLEIGSKGGNSFGNEDQAGPVQLLRAQFPDGIGICTVPCDAVVLLGEEGDAIKVVVDEGTEVLCVEIAAVMLRLVVVVGARASASHNTNEASKREE